MGIYTSILSIYAWTCIICLCVYVCRCYQPIHMIIYCSTLPVYIYMHIYIYICCHTGVAHQSKPVLVGHGVGTWISVLVASQRPDLIHGIVGM